MKTLVDANVLLDVITRDPAWGSWSENALREAAERSALTINPIVFAELSMKFERIEDADAALVDFARDPLPYEAGSWPAKPSSPTGAAGVPNAHQCPISTSGATRSSGGWSFSPGTRRATERTSLRSQSWRRPSSSVTPAAFPVPLCASFPKRKHGDDDNGWCRTHGRSALDAIPHPADE
jgi:hypothetical protein